MLLNFNPEKDILMKTETQMYILHNVAEKRESPYAELISDNDYNEAKNKIGDYVTIKTNISSCMSNLIIPKNNNMDKYKIELLERFNRVGINFLEI